MFVKNFSKEMSVRWSISLTTSGFHRSGGVKKNLNGDIEHHINKVLEELRDKE